MTGLDDADRIFCIGAADRASGLLAADASSEHAVRNRGAVRDATERLPDDELKRRACRREAELGKVVCRAKKVIAERSARLFEMEPCSSGVVRQELALRPGAAGSEARFAGVEQKLANRCR